MSLKPDPNQACGQGYPGQGSKAKIDVTVLIYKYVFIYVGIIFIRINEKLKETKHESLL